ncbi:MAG: hypothetical protein A3Q59_04205 [Methanomethylophilus alvi]|nr:MAG: hypothetical protein A3Q59_04205 [Methanomethylophilus alvi]
MFGGIGHSFENVEQFSKLGINVKTIRLTKNGGMKEVMKLFPVDFAELMGNDVFEESEVFGYFADHQFLFPIFAYTESGNTLDCEFKGFKRMGFDEDFIENHVLRVWTDTRAIIKENRLVRTFTYNLDGTMKKNPVSETYKSSLNFPKASHYYVFIKLGGRDSSDYTEEVNGIKMVKQWYWINTARLVKDLDKINFL